MMSHFATFLAQLELPFLPNQVVSFCLLLFLTLCRTSSSCSWGYWPRYYDYYRLSQLPSLCSLETNQTLHNIVSAVKYGHQQAFPTSSTDQQDFRESIVKCRVFQSDLSSQEASIFDEEYAKFFSTMVKRLPPARVAFQGASLIAGARVEIECDAVLHK